MDERRTNQSGFGLVEILLISVGLVFIGLVGWRIYQTHATVDRLSDAQGNPNLTANQSDTNIAPITTTADLSATEKLLDDTALDDSSTLQQLDAQLKF